MTERSGALQTETCACSCQVPPRGEQPPCPLSRSRGTNNRGNEAGATSRRAQLLLKQQSHHFRPSPRHFRLPLLPAPFTVGRSHADEGQVPHSAHVAVPQPGRRRLQKLGEGDDRELQHVGRAQRGGEVSAGAGLSALLSGIWACGNSPAGACVLLPSRKFVFFNIPQIQYKNPWVQIMLFKNMTPSPFLRFYLGRSCRPCPSAQARLQRWLPRWKRGLSRPRPARWKEGAGAGKQLHGLVKPLQPSASAPGHALCFSCLNVTLYSTAAERLMS